MSDECRKAFEKWKAQELDPTARIPAEIKDILEAGLLKTWQAAWSARGDGWVSAKTCPMNTPVQVVYYDRIAGEKTPMLAYAMRDSKGWLTYVPDNDAWDESCYSERWAVNHPELWQPLPEPPKGEE